jgi:hypothetical protein
VYGPAKSGDVSAKEISFVRLARKFSERVAQQEMKRLSGEKNKLGESVHPTVHRLENCVG